MDSDGLPGSAEVDSSIKLINDNAQRIFIWDYERDRSQLVTLYNRALSSQWNSVTDLDWSTEVDPERLVGEMAGGPGAAPFRVAAEIPGSPIATWGEKEFTRLGVELQKAAAQPVHARRAGRHDDGGQDRRDGALDRRPLLRVHPDDGRGPAHRGVRRYLHEKLGERLPDEPVPGGADHRRCSRTAAGTSPISACRSSSRAWPWPPSATCTGAPRSRS